MQDIIFTILLSLIPCCFSYFLDYCLGHPMSDNPQIKEVFSWYSLFLAKRRLDSIQNSLESGRSIFRNLNTHFYPMLSNDDPAQRRDGRDQLNKTIMLEAQKHFTFEKALGMCPFCTNFWISQAAATVFFFYIHLAFINPIFFFILIPIFSHTILRKL